MLRTSNSAAPEIGIPDIVKEIKIKNNIFKTHVCLVGKKTKETRENMETIMRKLKQGLKEECPDRNIIIQEKFPEEFHNYRETTLNSMINLKVLLPFSTEGDFISDAAVLKTMISEITDN